jgi:hypothetical protein
MTENTLHLPRLMRDVLVCRDKLANSVNSSHSFQLAGSFPRGFSVLKQLMLLLF